jgi:transcription elongation factor GreA
VADIEDILKNATIIRKRNGGSTVQVGATVELESSGKKVTYTIVGPVEADPLEGKISNESPIGQALIGKKEGDDVEIKTPKGKTTYKLVDIH